MESPDEFGARRTSVLELNETGHVLDCHHCRSQG